MKRIARLLSSTHGSQFRKNFVKVARANVLAKVMPLLAAPFLTRLYTPSSFGTVALFSVALGLVVAFSTWRFDWSVPNAPRKAVAASLIVLGFVSLMSVTIVVTLGVILLHESLTFWSGFATLGILIFFLPVALVGSGLNLLLRGWFVRENDLTAVSRSRIIESGAFVGVALLAGIVGFADAGMIAAKVISVWAGIPVLINHAKPMRDAIQRVTARRIRASLVRFRRESTWSTVVALINTASLSAPMFLLSQFYPVREFGWYALMMTVAAGPVGVVSTALGQSFWSEAAQLARAKQLGRLRKLYLRITLRLGLVSILVVLICAAGPLFVGPIFGEEEWGGAGYVLLAMTPMLIGTMVFSPTNHLIVLSQQAMQTIADGFRLALIVGTVFLAQMLDLDFFLAVGFVSIGSLAGHVAMFLFHLRAHSRYKSSVTLLDQSNR